MIRIFTYNRYLTPENRKLIFPLLLDLIYLKKGVLLDYYVIVKKLQRADIVVIPVDIKIFFKQKKVNELHLMIFSAKKAGKIVWVYSAGDIGKTLALDVFTFRFGGFHSKLDEHTFILPALVPDPYEDQIDLDSFRSLKKEDKPAIGFVGHAHNSRLMLIREYLVYLGVQLLNRKNKVLDYQSFFPTGILRYKSLRKLEQDNRIRTDFTFRKRYRAGAKTEEERQTTALEFFSNIRQNPYTFCLRGSGNFSTRFYETLAMGRIPVLINTDNRLPLPWMNWENHSIITDFDNLENDLLKFHNSTTEKKFELVQMKNRNFWESHLTREGYFIQIYDHFLKNHIR